MSKYRVTADSFIGNKMCRPDEIIDYNGDVSANLELVKEKKGVKTNAPTADEVAPQTDSPAKE